MRAIVFQTADKPLSIERVPDPAPLDGELVIRVGACGVCGSDLHAVAHPDSVFGTSLAAGTILGHEFAGDVVEVGNGAGSRWRVGDRVAAFPIYSCENCDACRTGHPANCRAARFLGLSGAQGAYAEYARVSSIHCLPLADHTPFHAAAMIEPLAVCLQAAQMAMPMREASVLIVGAGPIGLLLAAVCVHAGARHVVVSDLVAERADRAALVGATRGIDASSVNVAAEFRAITGRRPTIVFDAAGGAGGLANAMDLAGHGARIVVVAPCEVMSPVPTMSGFYKELSIGFAKAYSTAAFREAGRMIEARDLHLEPIVTDIVGFDDFPALFTSLGRPNGRGKVMLEPFMQQSGK